MKWSPEDRKALLSAAGPRPQAVSTVGDLDTLMRWHLKVAYLLSGEVTRLTAGQQQAAQAVVKPQAAPATPTPMSQEDVEARLLDEGWGGFTYPEQQVAASSLAWPKDYVPADRRAISGERDTLDRIRQWIAPRYEVPKQDLYAETLRFFGGATGIALDKPWDGNRTLQGSLEESPLWVPFYQLACWYLRTKYPLPKWPSEDRYFWGVPSLHKGSLLAGMLDGTRPWPTCYEAVARHHAQKAEEEAKVTAEDVGLGNEEDLLGTPEAETISEAVLPSPVETQAMAAPELPSPDLAPKKAEARRMTHGEVWLVKPSEEEARDGLFKFVLCLPRVAMYMTGRVMPSGREVLEAFHSGPLPMVSDKLQLSAQRFELSDWDSAFQVWQALKGCADSTPLDKWLGF